MSGNVIDLDADIKNLRMSLRAFDGLKQHIENLEHELELMRDLVDAAIDWRRMCLNGQSVDVARAQVALEVSADLYMSETEDGG